MTNKVKIPWDSIDNSSYTLLPDGFYNVSVESFEASMSSTGKRMFKARYRVEEPDQFMNMVLFDNYTIGNENDMLAEDAETWQSSIGAKQLKQIREATGCSSDDTESFVQEVLQQKLTVNVFTKMSEKYGAQNNINGFFALGEKAIGPKAKKPAPVTPPAKKAAKKKKAKQAELPMEEVTVPENIPPNASVYACPGCEEQVEKASLQEHMNSCDALV